jgi:hypothetical protein
MGLSAHPGWLVTIFEEPRQRPSKILVVRRVDQES